MEIYVPISSVEDLEEALRGADRCARVVVAVVGAADISEAAVMYRLLEIHLASRMGSLVVRGGGMESLRPAALHVEELGLLEIMLDLVELDLEAGISVKGARFQGVRKTANDVVTTAPATSTLSVLDSITIEAQRVARVAKALGFGAPDVDVPSFTEDDISWLTAEDVGSGKDDPIGDGDSAFHHGGHVHGAGACHDEGTLGVHGPVSALYGRALHLGPGNGGKDDVNDDGGHGHDEGAHGLDGTVSAVDFGALHLGPSNDGLIGVCAFHHRSHGHGEVACQNEGANGSVTTVDLGTLHLDIGATPGDSNIFKGIEADCNDGDKAMAAYKQLVLLKEEHVEALLRSKMAGVRAAIAAAKQTPWEIQ